MKKIICLIAVIAMIFVMGTVAFAAVESTDIAKIGDEGYATLKKALEAAVAGDEIVLLKDVNSSDIIYINKSVTINLNEHEVSSSNGKTFRIGEDGNAYTVVIKNGTVKNTYANGRCVDIRTNSVVTIEEVTLTATGSGNNQPITIGGSTDGTVLSVKDSEINATKYGYAIISFVKSDVTVTNSKLFGFADLYVKEGSEDSVFKFENSELKAVNDNPDPSNSFAAIVAECDDISVDFKNCSLEAEGFENSAKHIFAFGTKTKPVNEGIKVTMDAETTLSTTNGNDYFSVYKKDIHVLVVPASAKEKCEEEWLGLKDNGDGTYTAFCHMHKDEDGDHVCETGCGYAYSECSDEENDGDHLCDLCKKENISEHSWKDATCTEAKTCEECGETEGKELGHAWDDGKITKYPTYTEKGVMTYTCTKGGTEHFKTEEIPALVAADEENGTFDVIEGDDGTEYIVDYQEGVVFVPENLPEEVKDEFKTSEDIISAFEVKVSEGNLDQEKVETTVFEVTVGYFENDVFVPATEEFFEENKTLKITLPYPEGADRNDKFEIYHLNARTGEIDKYSTEVYGFYRITRTAKGLVIEVNSLSPFAIAFESVETAPSSGKLPGIIGGKPVTIIDGLPKEENESNPNTGAPAVSVVPVLVAAAAVFFKKR